MTTDEKMKLLQTWEVVICGMESEEDKLQVTLQPGADSPFISRLDILKIEYTRAVANLVDDTGDWLEWYWLENNMGAKGLPASRKQGKMKPVTSIRQLLVLIESPPAR
jgi:hypothetical protein